MSNEKEVEDFLAHYGKKGMKWGVRSKKVGVAKAAQTIRRVSAGSAFAGALIASRKSSNIGIIGLAGLGSAVAGGSFASRQLIRSGKTTKAELDAYLTPEE